MRLYYLIVGLICITVTISADLAGAWPVVSVASGIAAGTLIGREITARLIGRRATR